MDEDLIVLGAQAETPAAGGEASHATEAPEGTLPEGAEAATPGTEQAEAAAAPQPEAPKGEGEDEAPKPKKRTGIERMRDQIARLQAENASLRSAPTGAGADRSAAIEKEIGAAPKETDFDDYMAFERAQRQYDVRLALAEQRAADREAQSTTRAEQAQAEKFEAFQDRQDEAREKISDYDAVITGAKDREVKPHVGELVIESEKGALLAYYLAKNPEKLAELNRLSPLQAAKAIGALEHRLTLAKPNRTPSAPAPAKPLAGAAAPSSPDAEIEAYLASTYGKRGRA